MKSKSFYISRRSFVRRCSAFAAATGLPLWFVQRQVALADSPSDKVRSPIERPQIALIGCGKMGGGDARNANSFGDVVAFCDVDATHLNEKLELFKTKELNPKGLRPDGYNDFRKLLERDDIDAVINSTPDHWHSLINIAAARAGKDIYSQKPLTLTIDEGRHVVQAVRENQAILQTGTQQRSSKRFRLACELVRNGRIGKLKEVNVWLPAGYRQGPFQSTSVPDGLDWDFWQGPAPEADYMRQRCHFVFRYWYDYSGGTMTDWGAHHMDIGYWAIGQAAPTKIESKALSQPIPGGFTVVADYEVKFTYPDGLVFNVRTTRDESPFGATKNKDGQANGIRFVGSDGWIWVNRGTLEASDRELLTKPLPDDAERLYESNNHMGNFFDCMQSRKEPICPVEVGHRSSTVCHLGAISLRSGKDLTWDPENELFTGLNAEAGNQHIAREMRKPYDYSFVA